MNEKEKLAKALSYIYEVVGQDSNAYAFALHNMGWTREEIIEELEVELGMELQDIEKFIKWFY